MFGGEPETVVETVPLVGDKKRDGSKIQVVASIQKQDSKNSADSTECFVGHITHFRNGRLIKEGESFMKPLPSVSSDNSKNDEARDEPLDLEPTSEAIHQKGEMRRRRKLGTSTNPDTQQLDNSKGHPATPKKKAVQSSRINSASSLNSSRDNPLLLRTSCLRIGEDSINDKCSRCGLVKEEYSEDDIGNCIVILGTFISREPALTAPLLPEILLTVTRVARETHYSWELDSTIYVPCNSRSIAKQFIRCALHQLSGM